jgi:hypothetical protein
MTSGLLIFMGLTLIGAGCLLAVCGLIAAAIMFFDEADH